MDWTRRYGRHNSPWKPCCSTQLCASSWGVLHVVKEQGLLKLRSVKMPVLENSVALEVLGFDSDICTQAECLLTVRHFVRIRRVNWSPK